MGFLFSNEIKINFGHYYLNLNLGRYGVSTTYSITLPIACTGNYSAVAVPRNAYEMDIGVIQNGIIIQDLLIITNFFILWIR